MARTRSKQDAVIAVAGAVAVALAVLGLVVVESRPSIQAALEPAGVPVQATGSHERVPGQGTVLPGGTCVPAPPATQCTAPRTEIHWRLQGLPPAPEGGSYAAFLRSGSAHQPLGALQLEGGDHVLQHTAQDLDGTHIVLCLGSDPDVPGVILHEAALGALDVDFQAAPQGAGSARLDQIGAVSVSLLAAAELDAPLIPGLVYRAWLEEDGRVQHLDDLAVQGGRVVLDVRVERVHIPVDGRILVSLEGPQRSDAPAGFPAFAAQIHA